MTDYERSGEYESSGHNRFLSGLTFLFIGLGVGAAVALLFAPKTGKQMRRALRRGYQDARERIEDWGDQAGDLVERGTEWAKDMRERVEPVRKAIRVK